MEMSTKNGIVLFLFSVALFVGKCECGSDTVPIIELVKLIKTDTNALVDWIGEKDEIISLNGNIYTVTSEAVALVFRCRAPYPIQWDFLQAKYMFPRESSLNLIRTRTMRVVPENGSLKNSEYFAQIILFGDNRIFNGNYTCRDTTRSEIRNDIYLFWEADKTDQNLVLHGRHFTLSVESNDYVTLPCYVTKPDSEVLLFKMLVAEHALNETIFVEDTWEPLALNNSIDYLETKGFILKTRELSGIVGKYKCESSGTKDFLTVDIVQNKIDSDATRLDDVISTNATLIYEAAAKDEKQGKFTCCSSSSRAPKLTELYCDSPVTCQLNRNIITSDWGFTRLIQRTLKVRQLVNGSCTSSPRLMAFRDSAVLVRCIGDGINVLKEMFFPLAGKTLTPYSQWSQANPTDLILMGELKNKVSNPNSTLTVFPGQKITFQCRASTYYYSLGSMWGIGWSNGNLTYLLDSLSQQALKIKLIGELNTITTELTVEAGMTHFACLAPVWNSTDWVSKKILLDVLIPELPRTDYLNEEIYWTLNDTSKTLNCSMKGKPTPTLIWTKDDKIITEYNVTTEIKPYTITSILHVPNVTHDVQGEYKCTGNNYAEDTVKVFHVFTQERTPWDIILVVGFILFWLFGGLIAFTWKMKSQEQELGKIQHSVYRSHINSVM